MAYQVPVWQENKSRAERHLYMLQNNIATDVCFEFCSPEGSVTPVNAHTSFLIASSPVFEAMFCGGMAEARPDRENIKIEDIDADIFNEMLRFGLLCSQVILCITACAVATGCCVQESQLLLKVGTHYPYVRAVAGHTARTSGPDVRVVCRPTDL